MRVCSNERVAPHLAGHDGLLLLFMVAVVAELPGCLAWFLYLGTCTASFRYHQCVPMVGHTCGSVVTLLPLALGDVLWFMLMLARKIQVQ